MAGYRDWMLIDNPRSLTFEEKKEAVKAMGKAANSRLYRMEKAKVTFGDLPKQEGVTAGVRRFTVRGKDEEALNREFTRVKNFLNDPQSSLSGMWEQVKQFDKAIDSFDEQVRRVARRRKRLSRKEMREENKRIKQQEAYGNERDYEQLDTSRGLTRYEKIRAWRELWDVYNYLQETGEYAKDFQDSQQVREIVYSVTSSGVVDMLSTEEMIQRARDILDGKYEMEKKKQNQSSDGDISTSSLINLGASD